jgi:tetratricopeptide (TPR) repeat protein
MSATLNERRFARYYKAAVDKYNQALDAKKGPNKIKHANAALKEFYDAKELLPIIGKQKNEPLLWEYITLCEGLIGSAHYDDGNYAEAILQFEKAQTLNKKTPQNNDAYLRELFFFERLLEIAKRTNQLQTAEGLAIKIFHTIKHLYTVSEKVEMLLKIKQIFFETKNVTYIEKVYKELIGLSKKAKGDLEKTKAYIFTDYARYLETILNKHKDAAKFFSEALDIFEKLGIQKEVEDITKFMTEKNMKRK